MAIPTPKSIAATVSRAERKLGLTLYPFWLRYLGAALFMIAASALMLWLGDGGRFGVIDALKYVVLIASLLFVGRALWRIQQKESNLYYGNFLSQMSLLFATRRERVRSAVIAFFALTFGMAFLCFSVSALLYALASDGLYNPFKSAPGFGSVFLFVIDQALKGGLFDLMEIFSIDLSDLTVNANEKWFFGSFLVVFRLFFSIIVIGAFIAYVFERAMQLAGYRIGKT